MKKKDIGVSVRTQKFAKRNWTDALQILYVREHTALEAQQRLSRRLQVDSWRARPGEITRLCIATEQNKIIFVST